MGNASQLPPGQPGIPARWTSSAKDGIGAAISSLSRVWFTHSHGILNEIYYPSVDQACTRDFGLIVTDGRDFFSEEKRDTVTQVQYLAPGVPAFKITNRCRADRYLMEKILFADPNRDVVFQKVRFQAAAGPSHAYRVFALLAPHLGNCGAGNNAWLGDYKGRPLFFAERDGVALALASSVGWKARSVGYVGVSDGWQDLSRHKQMTWSYDRAENGNVAVTGELDLRGSPAEFVLALGFGQDAEEAGFRAIASLEDDFASLQGKYVDEWQQWQSSLLELHYGETTATQPPARDTKTGAKKGTTKTWNDQTGTGPKKASPVSGAPTPDLYRTSTAVMRCHEDKRFPGGIIASLSVPWGFAKGDEDLGGYHLAWPRDLCETAGGLLAAGAVSDALRVIRYLQTTQEADGHWAQNMWLDGRSYWKGIQMDETAFPILLVDLAIRVGALAADEALSLWDMVRRAASFLICNGPVTPQDRWEEDAGYSPFTLSAEIAALLAAADLAEKAKDPLAADYLRQTADVWYANLDRWIYASDTQLAQKLGIDGYYVRIAPPETSDACSPLQGFVAIKNRPPDQAQDRAVNIVSPDALALVRFGLRRADDPRIVNTMQAIDHLVRVELPQGPCWYRYSDDGYGEHPDGRPFDGTGIGRPWPLLIGERAHVELAAGRMDEACRLQRVFRDCANASGLLPEQSWDADNIPDRELVRGRPAGSAMPLVWAHAEYVKLLRSLSDNHVFDMPPQTVKRYLESESATSLRSWRFNHKCRELPVGKTLRIELPAPAQLHWSSDGWQTFCETPTTDSHLGIHFADLETDQLSVGSAIDFTMRWLPSNEWEGFDFRIKVTP